MFEPGSEISSGTTDVVFTEVVSNGTQQLQNIPPLHRSSGRWPDIQQVIPNVQWYVSLLWEHFCGKAKDVVDEQKKCHQNIFFFGMEKADLVKFDVWTNKKLTKQKPGYTQKIPQCIRHLLRVVISIGIG